MIQIPHFYEVREVGNLTSQLLNHPPALRHRHRV
jgi:hypothetical protein